MATFHRYQLFGTVCVCVCVLTESVVIFLRNKRQLVVDVIPNVRHKRLELAKILKTNHKRLELPKILKHKSLDCQASFGE